MDLPAAKEFLKRVDRPLGSRILLFSFFLVLGCSSVVSPFPTAALGAKQDFDVVIYGATPAGIAAAIAVGRMGEKAAIIEPGKFIGGMMSGGLAGTDVGLEYTTGGISREFFENVTKHYGQDTTWRFEPHVATKIFNKMLKKAKVKVYRESRIESAVKERGWIKELKTVDGKTITAKVFLDATYEGDLLALAGVPYVVGREAASEFDEIYGGVVDSTVDQFVTPLSGLDSEGNLLPGIQRKGAGKLGSADKAVAAYCFRPCITTVESNRIPFYPPPNYDPSRHKLLANFLKANPLAKLREIFTFLKIPKKKYDLNNRGPVSLDMLGENWDYPDASYEQRQKIIAAHEHYTKSILYFVANDPSMPKEFRDEFSKFGYCKDEFVDNNNFPHQLYIRVGRRMRGEYVMTEHDIRLLRVKYDSIGMGSNYIEAHHAQRVVNESGHVKNEGFVYLKGLGRLPYELPYRSITPKARDAKNLLVPVAFSSTHIGYSSIRMEPVYMLLGHSAGVAAVMALREELPVQDISWKNLQRELRRQKQRIKGFVTN